MKKLWLISITVVVVLLWVFAVPAFAQTRLAGMIPGQPLTGLAATQIIRNSGLPLETLPNGITNQITRGRDVINAYRLAHQKLYENGWYRGISDDHAPLIQAMTEALKGEGYKGESDSAVLSSFFSQSDEENAAEIGYPTVEIMMSNIAMLKSTGRDSEAKIITDALATKWR